MHIHICQNITLQTSELHSPVIKLDFVYVNFWHSYFIRVFCNILQPVGGGCLGCIFHPSKFQSKGSHQALPVCFFQKNKSTICFLYWLHFLIDKQLKAEIHMPVFFQNTCHRLCVDSNFLPWKFTSEMFFDSIILSMEIVQQRLASIPACFFSINKSPCPFLLIPFFHR